MTHTVVHFVDSAVYGGTEKSMVYLLAGLDRRRWKPVLFHHAEPGMALMVEEAHRLNIKTKVVSWMRGIGTISGLPEFIAHLQTERPVIFHAHLSWLLSCKYGLIAAALAKVPAVIATAQQYMEPPWGRTVFLQQQLVQHCVDQYLAVSEAVAQQLQKTFRVPSHKVRMIHNSIPCDVFDKPSNPELRAAFCNGTGQPIVLTVARLDQQKGLTYLLKAIRQIPDGLFILAGSGPESSGLKAEAQALGISDRVYFLGHRTDIPDLLASCDLFVLPSVYEGFPLSVLEAMAAGKPVVATAVGGTPEAVIDGKTGFLVPPGDPAALASGIRKILSNPGLACEMGAAGRLRVKLEFSAAAMIQRVTQVYEETLIKYVDEGFQV